MNRLSFSARLRTLTALSLLALVPACGTSGTEPDARVRDIIITGSAGLDVEMRQQYTAQAVDADGVPLDVPIAWSTTDSSVATVSATGLVTALTPGWISIMARAGAVERGMSLRVFDPNITYRTNPDTLRLLVGQTRQIALVHPSGFSETISKVVGGWTSSDPSVARVDSLGVVTGVAPGAAIVGVRYAGVAFWSFVRVPNVPVPLHFTSVAVDNGIPCGTVTDGDTYCWGWFDIYHAGSADGLDRCLVYASNVSPSHTAEYRDEIYTCALSPVRLETSARFTSLASPCGTTADGVVDCWWNRTSLTGATDRWAVSPIPTSLRFTQFDPPCGVTAAHDAWCWGSIAVGAATPAGTGPTQVQGPGMWRFVTGGEESPFSVYRHRCGISTADAVYCWGANARGQLGTGDTLASATPVAVHVPATETFTSVGSGDDAACALARSGIIYCWGGGQLVPAPLSTSLRFTALSMREYKICGIGTDGIVSCGSGPSNLAPISSTIRFRTLSVGRSQSCGIGVDDYVYCWGATVPFGALTAAPTRVVGQ